MAHDAVDILWEGQAGHKHVEWAKEGTLSQQQWGPQIKKHIKQVMGQRAWEARVIVNTTEGSVDEFMNRGNSGRDILGQALRSQLLGLVGEGLDLSFVAI
jgi:hypothetical protein